MAETRDKILGAVFQLSSMATRLVQGQPVAPIINDFISLALDFIPEDELRMYLDNHAVARVKRAADIAQAAAEQDIPE